MKCSLINLVLILIFYKSSCSSEENIHSLSKRFLIVPPTSPTRHQLIWGIGIPADYEYQSIVNGIVLKAQYFLPTETAHLYPNQDYYPGLFKRKKRDADNNQTNLVERYDQEVVLLEEKTDFEIVQEYEKNEWDDDEEDEDEDEDEEDQFITPDNFKIDFKNSRWTAYKIIENLAETKGYQGQGRVCVLRGICEAAETPFTHRSGLLGELVHIFLAPTTTNENVSEHSDNDYLIAERHGKAGGKCDEIYKECNESLLEVFSGVNNPLDWIL